MPVFSYTVLQDGKERTGSIEAISLQAARDALKQSGLVVQEIHEASGEEQKIILPWERGVVVETTKDPKDIKDSKDSKEMSNHSFESFESSGSFLITLRIYAGWLLAWYALVFMLGSYQLTKRLPFELPYVDSLVQSPLLPRFAFGAFLFLLLTTVYLSWNRGIIKGILLTIVGVAVWWGFHIAV